MIYPNSVPEFRLFARLDGEQVFQVRYVCHQQRYTGPWQDVPVVREDGQTHKS